MQKGRRQVVQIWTLELWNCLSCFFSSWLQLLLLFLLRPPRPSPLLASLHHELRDLHDKLLTFNPPCAQCFSRVFDLVACFDRISCSGEGRPASGDAAVLDIFNSSTLDRRTAECKTPFFPFLHVFFSNSSFSDSGSQK